MSLRSVLLASALVSGFVSFGFAQAQNGAATPSTLNQVPAAPAQIYDKMLSDQERLIEAAAQAMPPDKFNFEPATADGNFIGVRTFAEQIKHIAEANYAFFRGWKVPGARNRGDIAKLTSRDDILAALSSSFTYAHAAVATITMENVFADKDGKGNTRAGAVTAAMIHTGDIYGQMVEYLRMNGVIPPASRK